MHLFGKLTYIDKTVNVFGGIEEAIPVTLFYRHHHA
jgi:hypothetical protein